MTRSENSRVLSMSMAKPAEHKYFKVVIDWIRHAESCANVDAGNLTDKYQGVAQNMVGYTVRRPAEAARGADINYEKYLHWGFPAKNLIRPELRNLNDFRRNIRDGSLDPVTPPLRFNSKNIFKNTKKNICRITYHPNLSFIGMQQASKLGEFLAKTEQKYHFVLVSASIRTIMTAMIAFIGEPDVTLYVVPYINEKINMSCMDVDYQNLPVSSVFLQNKIPKIRQWLQNNWINEFDDIRVMDALQSISTALQIIEYRSVESDSDDYWNSIATIVTKITDFVLRKIPKTAIKPDVKSWIRQILDDIQRVIQLNPHLQRQDLISPPIVSPRDAYILIVYKGFHAACNFLNAVTQRGEIWPKISYQWLQEYENDTFQDSKQAVLNTLIRESNANIFYRRVLPKIFQNLTNTDTEIYIACFSHGQTIRKFLERYPGYSPPKIRNTQIIREIFTNSEEIIEPSMAITARIDEDTFLQHLGTWILTFEYYLPKSIRDTYGKFDDLNIDVCDKEAGINDFINSGLRLDANHFQYHIQKCRTYPAKCKYDKSIKNTFLDVL